MIVIIIINQAGFTITCNSQLHEFDWLSYDLLILGCLRIFSFIQKLSHLYDLFGYNLVFLSLVTLDAGFDHLRFLRQLHLRVLRQLHQIMVLWRLHALLLLAYSNSLWIVADGLPYSLSHWFDQHLLNNSDVVINNILLKFDTTMLNF